MHPGFERELPHSLNGGMKYDLPPSFNGTMYLIKAIAVLSDVISKHFKEGINTFKECQ